MQTESKSNLIMTYSGIIGILYLIYGVAEILYSAGIDFNTYFVFPFWSDPFAGFSLIVVGLIFLTPLISKNKGYNEKLAYVYVGGLIASLLLVIHVLVLLSDFIEWYILLNEEFVGWTMWSDINPAIPLGIVALPAVYLLYKSKLLSTHKEIEKVT